MSTLRIPFEMSQSQLDRLLDAMKSVPFLVIGGMAPRSQQENANAAWQALGDEMGFVWDSVMPEPSKGERSFLAIPKAKAKAKAVAAAADPVLRAMVEDDIVATPATAVLGGPEAPGKPERDLGRDLAELFDMKARPAPPFLPTMHSAFRTLQSGGEIGYAMVFEFPDLATLHCASHEWHSLRHQTAFDRDAINRFREWFGNTQDLNPGYLQKADYELGSRLYELLDLRVPHSVLTGAGRPLPDAGPAAADEVSDDVLQRLWDPTLGPCGVRALNALRAAITADRQRRAAAPAEGSPS